MTTDPPESVPPLTSMPLVRTESHLTADTALTRPGMHDEIRRLAARRPRPLRERLRLRADDTAFRLATWLDDHDHDKAAGRLYRISKRLSHG